MIVLKVEALTAAKFALFGDVIETGGEALVINAGFAQRFTDLCSVETAEQGATNVSIFVARQRKMPLQINMMERHPLGSQAFVPLQEQPWMAIVCADPDDAASFRAFRCTGRQGVNYRRGVWHFPLVTFGDGDRFLVVDRKGPGDNLVEYTLPDGRQMTITG